ncbi:MAG: c-type cytochrome [Nitrospirae bacterium]|nr:c-type cytochrome [Nitrospirota bacterium]
MLASVFIVSSVFAAGMTGGDVEKGKALFNDPKSFGGTVSCSSCHPDGKGLGKAGMKGRTEWKNPAGTYKSLEEAINVCITAANKGKAIDVKSQEMKDMVAYIRSLAMEMKHEMPMKEKKMGY